jgi:hypothetical protein
MLDKQKFINKEQIHEELSGLIKAWQDTWHEPGSGPMPHTESEARLVGALTEFKIQKKAYTNVLDYISTTLICAQQFEEEREALFAIRGAFGRHLGGSHQNNLWIRVLNDSFVITLKNLRIRERTGLYQKVADLIQNRRAALEKNFGFGYMEGEAEEIEKESELDDEATA